MPVLERQIRVQQTATTSPFEVNSGRGTVSVADQPAGNSAIVESVTVPPPGVWVAVRDMTGNMVGNILGAAHARGPVSLFEVPLLRSTVSGRTYAITLYRDDGDDAFDLEKDSAYVDFDTGERVLVLFKAL